MQFDPDSAIFLYGQKETDDLVRIAFLEDDYVDGAKKLAKEELARRGLPEVDKDTIERVRAEVERQRIADVERQLQRLETEEEVPSWRQAIRLRLAPYRDLLSLLTIVLAGSLELNSTFNWGAFYLDGRKSEGIGMSLLLIWLVFIAPTRREFIDKHYYKDGRRKS